MTLFRVKPDGKVTIGIAEEKKKPEGEGDENDYIGVDGPDDQPYTFRKIKITLFDLGTRRNEDGTYRYVDLGNSEPLHFPDENPFILDPTTVRANYHTALITDDYATSLKLPLHSEYLYTDLVFKQTDKEDYRVLAGANNTRPYVKDCSLITPLPFVGRSRWNKGTVIKGSGDWSVGVESGFFYNNFDTNDTENFKVTATSDSSTDVVEFSIQSGDTVQVYLTPRLYVSTDDEPPRIFSGRLPVIPNFLMVKDPIFTLVRGFADAVPKFITADANAYYTEIENYLLSLNPDHTNVSGVHHDADFNAYMMVYTTKVDYPDFYAPVLVSIIVKNKVAFYVWRVGVGEEETVWPTSLINAPA